MATSIFIRPQQGIQIVTAPVKFANGTSAAPGISFVGSGFDGFYWNSAGHIVYTSQGNQSVDFGTGLTLNSTYAIGWANNSSPAGGSGLDTAFARAAAGQIQLYTGAIGSRLKVDALPTVASGFGTSPSILAGSTPFAGGVNVGTGGVAVSGVINFNGTAFGTAPFVALSWASTNAVTRVSAVSTTQLTLSSTTAWTASDIIYWIAVSPK